MAENTNRWFIDTEGPGPTELRPAFTWFRQQIANSPDRQGLLAVPGKGNLEHIQAIVGPAVVRQLRKDNRARFGDGTITLMTERTNPYFWSGPVLVLYADDRLLDKVDSLQTPSNVLFVPWRREEGRGWAHMWSARELGSSAEPSTRRFSNPTVRAALESLTHRVNLSTGLAHSSDKAAAVQMFRLLHDGGEQFDPEEIRSWLISELGWEPRHANEVREVASGVLAGRNFRVSSSSTWAPGIVKRWREQGARENDV